MTMQLDPASAAKPYKVGTLAYDRRGLVTVFAWLLWGDFCLYLMDAGVGNNLPTLQLQKYGASNTLITVIKTSAVELVLLVLCPIVSTWSDRYRSRLGRRIPFMLFATPPLALFIALLGFSPTIAGWLKSISPHLLGTISAANLTIALISVTLLGYKFFDTFPQSVYYYIWADVIPAEFMGRFVCMFRLFSTLGVFVFNRWLLKYCTDYPGAMCLGASGLYLVSFLLMCWRVREGEYPPPEPTKPGPLITRTADSVWRFFRECFGHSFYWKYYIFVLAFMVGFVPFRDYLLLYGNDVMGLDRFGKLMSNSYLVQMAIFLVLGPVVDKLHPMRAGFASFVLLFVTVLISFVSIHSGHGFSACVMIIFAMVAVYQGATGALGPRLLPRSHYGQFCAASALVFHFGQMLLAPVLGILMDKFGRIAVFPWFFCFSGLGIFFMCLLYRDWLRYGGDESYVPPLTTGDPNDAAFELMTKH